MLNDLTCQGYQILREKTRSDGFQVVLANLRLNGWCVSLLDKDGRILNSKCFFWCEKIEKRVKLQATREFTNWRKLLLQHKESELL